MIAISRPMVFAISRTICARPRWSLAAPCEKLRRTQSTPAASIRWSTAGSLQAGPRVATILVARGKGLPSRWLSVDVTTKSSRGSQRALESTARDAAAIIRRGRR